MKGLLLRVGIDSGSGGCLAPIFNDGSFEFIPIPETRATLETRLYANTNGLVKGENFSKYVPAKIKYSHPHYDPEFETFTYGDPTSPKRNQLSGLKPGDILIFYAGLEPEDESKKPRLYVIGFFIIEKVYDFNEFPKKDYPLIFKKLQNNAHSKIYFKLQEFNDSYSEENLVIVKGDINTSKLLTRAIPISDNNWNMLKKLEHIFGYKGSLLRAVAHWIKEENISKVKKWLNENSE